MRAHRLVWIGLGIGCSSGTRVPSPIAAQVRPGIEVLLSDSAHLIAGKRLGLLTNNTGVDHLGRRDVDLLRTAPGTRLTVLFSPEHGFRGTEDRSGLPDGRDSATGLPIYSLYGGSRTAARAAVDSVDVLLIDLQDIGARYYTYIATTVQLMRDATRAGKRVIVLDRTDPIGGIAVQGNVRAKVGDPDSAFSGFMPVAMRYGMTLGELARMANDVMAVGPTDFKYPGVALRGVRLRVRDREHYDPTRLAIALLAAIRAAHPAQFQFRAQSFDRLAAGPELRIALDGGRTVQEIWDSWKSDLERFRETRAKYLI